LSPSLILKGIYFMAEQIHETQTLLTHGADLADADKAVILIHGRGASAEDIMKTGRILPQGKIAYLAPQASGNVWYPNSGFGPLEANEPYLSSAMQTITNLVEKALNSGISSENIYVGGFSQGGCLISEYVAQNPRNYGGVFILSGAIMGTMDRDYDYDGKLTDVPVFIGGVDNDSWVKPPQFERTRDVLTDLGADVTLQVLKGSEHTIRKSEIEHISKMIAG